MVPEIRSHVGACQCCDRIWLEHQVSELDVIQFAADVAPEVVRRTEGSWPQIICGQGRAIDIATDHPQGANLRKRVRFSRR